MNANQIETEIKKLPIKSASDSYNAKIEAKIAETATLLEKLLPEKGLQISKGSASPSTTRSYSRIYLETSGNTSHDSRHSDCGVICTWEWETRNKYGSQPISGKQIVKMCDSLIKRVGSYNA